MPKKDKKASKKTLIIKLYKNEISPEAALFTVLHHMILNKTVSGNESDVKPKGTKQI